MAELNLKGKHIKELTGDRAELRYDTAGETPTYDFIPDLCTLLGQAGYPVTGTNQYDQYVSEAVKNFQRDVMGMNPPTGILTDSTLGSLIVHAESKASNTIGGNDYGDADDDNSGDGSGNPHYNSYFSEDNQKTYRKNRGDIKIVFGNKSITKTIHEVFIRSQSVEIDTSGNPISEVYEFIARDVTESDEPMDSEKYLPGVSSITAPSDVQYDFSAYFKNRR